MSLRQAIEIASSAGLDLVEVSPNAEPPVCRVMDFGKYLFEQNKKAQTSKRKQKHTPTREGTRRADRTTSASLKVT
jgi:translation initiation factor IF-3